MHAVNLGILFTCNGASLMHILRLASLFNFRVGPPHFQRQFCRFVGCKADLQVEFLLSTLGVEAIKELNISPNSS